MIATRSQTLNTQHDRTTSPVLSVDREGPVFGMDPWQHVGQRQGDQWQRPDGALDEQLHLMVETMEAWFYGDREALQKFYGPTFRASALSARTNVETIPKGELVSGLKAATSNCQKGEYAKGAHSFLILERLHPARVRAASPVWCERFLRSLDQIRAII